MNALTNEQAGLLCSKLEAAAMELTQAEEVMEDRDYNCSLCERNSEKNGHAKGCMGIEMQKIRKLIEKLGEEVEEAYPDL